MNTAKHRTTDALPQPSLRGAYATIAESSFPESAHVMRRLLVFLVLAAALAAACALTWNIAWQRGIDELRRNAALRVDRTTSTLKSTLDRYEYLPYLLSRHPFIQDVLDDPNAPNIARADRYLEDLNGRARATVTYIIRTNGLCVAASNWRAPDSFVGSEYQFRPYFIDAAQGNTGRFFGLGTVSREPGYYISQPVYREGTRELTGVAVVKLNLEWLQSAYASEPLIVTDDHGVIFLSSVPAWKYHTVRPLPKNIEASVFATRQYAQQTITPLPLTVVKTLPGDAQIVRVGVGRNVRSYLATRRSIGEPDWQLITMAPLDPVVSAARTSAIVTALVFVSLCLLAFYWRMRRVRVREMIRGREMLQTAYAELNQRVAERTADSVGGQRATDEGSERAHARRAGPARRPRRTGPGEQARRARPDGGRHHARAESTARGVAQFLRQHARPDRARRPGGGAGESRSDRVADRADGQHHQPAEAVRREGASAQRAHRCGTRAAQRARDAAPAHAERRARCRARTRRRERVGVRALRGFAAGAGADQPDRQRARRGRLVRFAAHLDLPRHARRRDRARRARQRPRHSRRCAAAPLRAVLHDEGDGARPRARPGDFIGDRARLRRHARGAQPGGGAGSQTARKAALRPTPIARTAQNSC